MDRRILFDLFDRNIKHSSILLLVVVGFLPMLIMATTQDDYMSALMLGLLVFILLGANLNEINPQKPSRVMGILPVERQEAEKARWGILVLAPLLFALGLVLVQQGFRPYVSSHPANPNQILSWLITLVIWVAGTYTMVRCASLIKQTELINSPALNAAVGIVFGLLLGGSLFIFLGLNWLWHAYPGSHLFLSLCAPLLFGLSYSLTTLDTLPFQVIPLPSPAVQRREGHLPAMKINRWDRFLAHPLGSQMGRFTLVFLIFGIVFLGYFQIFLEVDTISYLFLIPLMAMGMHPIQPLRMHVSLPVSRLRIYLDYIGFYVCIFILSMFCIPLVGVFLAETPFPISFVMLLCLIAFNMCLLLAIVQLEADNPQFFLPFIFGAFLGVFNVLVISKKQPFSSSTLFILWMVFLGLAAMQLYLMWRIVSRSSKPYQRKIQPQEHKG